MKEVEFFYVSSKDEGLRVDRWISENLKDINYVHAQKLIRSGQVRVDGSRIKANARLLTGQKIRIPPHEEYINPVSLVRSIPDNQKNFIKSLVIYEDSNIMVLNKPYGLATQGGQGIDNHVDRLLSTWDKEGKDRYKLVHRLDKNTTGVLIVAKNRKSANFYANCFKDRSVKKIYWAIVFGVPDNSMGKIDLPVNERSKKYNEPGDKHKTQHAITKYKVIDFAGKSFSLLHLQPITGRKHQLRVHLSSINNPILGDEKYSLSDYSVPSELDNLMHLHAKCILITSLSGKILTIDAPIPKHFVSTIKYLGLSYDDYIPEDIF
jgi:23S rRNA pseudouridine955/2504/2580 synthase